MITKALEKKNQPVPSGNQVQSATPEGKRVKDSLYLIRTIAIRYVFFIFVWIIMLVVGAIEYLNINKRNWPRGGVLYFGFLLDGGFICPVLAMICILQYLHQITQTKTKKKVLSLSTTDNTSNDPKKDINGSFAYVSGTVTPGNI